MEDLKLSKIQFKRGPSNKLDLVSKYSYEPIVLTDLEELLIWRENQSPIRFKPYTGYFELDKLEEDFEDEEILGKVWADHKGVIKFGTLIDSKISIISIDDLVNSTVLNSELNEFKNKIIDELSTDDFNYDEDKDEDSDDDYSNDEITDDYSENEDDEDYSDNDEYDRITENPDDDYDDENDFDEEDYEGYMDDYENLYDK